jgi:hypothetical protein
LVGGSKDWRVGQQDRVGGVKVRKAGGHSKTGSSAFHALNPCNVFPGLATAINA